MSLYFLDTSALVKRYIREQGTFWVRQLTASHQKHLILISPITFVETASTLSRRQREGSLDHPNLVLMLQLVRRHFHRQYTLIAFVQDIEDTAENLLLNYPLRALDAIQLVSALFIQQEILRKGQPASITFVSADDRLLKIAQQVGFVIENPNQYR